MIRQDTGSGAEMLETRPALSRLFNTDNNEIIRTICGNVGGDGFITRNFRQRGRLCASLINPHSKAKEGQEKE